MVSSLVLLLLLLPAAAAAREDFVFRNDGIDLAYDDLVTLIHGQPASRDAVAEQLGGAVEVDKVEVEIDGETFVVPGASAIASADYLAVSGVGEAVAAARVKWAVWVDLFGVVRICVGSAVAVDNQDHYQLVSEGLELEYDVWKGEIHGVPASRSAVAGALGSMPQQVTSLELVIDGTVRTVSPAGAVATADMLVVPGLFNHLAVAQVSWGIWARLGPIRICIESTKAVANSDSYQLVADGLELEYDVFKAEMNGAPVSRTDVARALGSTAKAVDTLDLVIDGVVQPVNPSLASASGHAIRVSGLSHQIAAARISWGIWVRLGGIRICVESANAVANHDRYLMVSDGLELRYDVFKASIDGAPASRTDIALAVGSEPQSVDTLDVVVDGVVQAVDPSLATVSGSALHVSGVRDQIAAARVSWGIWARFGPIMICIESAKAVAGSGSYQLVSEGLELDYDVFKAAIDGVPASQSQVAQVLGSGPQPVDELEVVIDGEVQVADPSLATVSGDAIAVTGLHDTLAAARLSWGIWVRIGGVRICVESANAVSNASSYRLVANGLELAYDDFKASIDDVPASRAEVAALLPAEPQPVDTLELVIDGVVQTVPPSLATVSRNEIQVSNLHNALATARLSWGIWVRIGGVRICVESATTASNADHYQLASQNGVELEYDVLKAEVQGAPVSRAALAVALGDTARQATSLELVIDGQVRPASPAGILATSDGMRVNGTVLNALRTARLSWGIWARFGSIRICIESAKSVSNHDHFRLVSGGLEPAYTDFAAAINGVPASRTDLALALGSQPKQVDSLQLVLDGEVLELNPADTFVTADGLTVANLNEYLPVAALRWGIWVQIGNVRICVGSARADLSAPSALEAAAGG